MLQLKLTEQLQDAVPENNKPFGNIFDKDFKLFEKPMPCEAEICPCDEYKWIVDEER